MGAGEEHAAAMMLLSYAKNKKKLALLQEEAHAIGVRLKNVSKLLKNSPQDISLEGSDGELIASLDPGRIAALVIDIRDTLAETQQVEVKLKELGLTL